MTGVEINKIQNDSLKTSSNFCLCKTISKILFLGRIVGIWPITQFKRNGNSNMHCAFWVSKANRIYSAIIICIYTIYTFSTYTTYSFCNEIKKADWYIMSTGYFLTDIDSLITLISGAYYSSRICKVLYTLSHIKHVSTNYKKINAQINQFLIKIFTYFIFILSSYIYIGIWRYYHFHFVTFSCSVVETTPAVFIRGITVIFPTVQFIFLYTLCLIIDDKFEKLSELTATRIENMKIVVPLGNGGGVFSTVHGQRTSNYSEQLREMTEIHTEIFNCINEINICNGFQLLIENCSSLYATVYYLYRYFTSNYNTTASNNHDRIHYILGLSYRLFRLIMYMILGEKLLTRSKLPLKTLLRSKLLSLPTNIQHQIQTLILQWQGEEGYLSALGVVRLGPWLSAPIVGNIITYLLVALQFNKVE